MSINWVRIYNRLFEIINSDGDAYFSGSRFISKVREVDPYFHDYLQYIEERRQSGKSTSRNNFFYDILLSFEEKQRLEILKSILDEVRDVSPDKVAALEAEMDGAQGSYFKPVINKMPNSALGSEISKHGTEAGDPPTYMYHETKAPEGQIFKASEVPRLERAGWVDSPAKFGKGPRFKTIAVLSVLKKFWLDHWKWIIGAVIAFAAVVVSYIKG